jgi:DNA-binding phage protein
MNYYVIISSNEEVFIRKYLSKVENLTGIAQNTLSKHFSINKQPYINNKWSIFKTSNVDLKSFNKGNKYNFIT